MAKDAKQVMDITAMTDNEIAAYMQQRKAQQAKMIAEKGKEARKDVENYCQQKWGLTLVSRIRSSLHTSATDRAAKPLRGLAVQRSKECNELRNQDTRARRGSNEGKGTQA